MDWIISESNKNDLVFQLDNQTKMYITLDGDIWDAYQNDFLEREGTSNVIAPCGQITSRHQVSNWEICTTDADYLVFQFHGKVAAAISPDGKFWKALPTGSGYLKARKSQPVDPGPYCIDTPILKFPTSCWQLGKTTRNFLAFNYFGVTQICISSEGDVWGRAAGGCFGNAAPSGKSSGMGSMIYSSDMDGYITKSMTDWDQNRKNLDFADLQNLFYTAVAAGLEYKSKDPFQLVQPSIPLVSGSDPDKANRLLWNYFNNIPPFSLTQNVQTGTGSQFFSNYAALLSTLTSPDNAFEKTIGDKCSQAWISYVNTLAPNTNMNNFPMIFRNWAMNHGYASAAVKGASVYAQMLLDPIFNAMQCMLLYQNPDGTYKDPDWDAGIDVLKKTLPTAPSRTFMLNNQTMSFESQKTWAQKTNSGLFGLFSNEASISTLSTKFSSSYINVRASFKHVYPFSATPRNWYSSAAMAMAYNNKEGAPWDPDKAASINWDNTFDPKTGNMTRFATTLIVADTMNVRVYSDCQYSSNEQAEINNNKGCGMWPFYSSGVSEGMSTDVSFDSTGAMTVSIKSDPGTPVVIGLIVEPVNQFIGHHQ